MKEITDDTFEAEVLAGGRPALLYFWAPTCMPCKLMKPDIEEMEEGFGDQLVFTHTDAVANDGVCQKYGVLSTPTIIIFNQGEPVLRIVGYVTREDLKSKITEQLKAM